MSVNFYFEKVETKLKHQKELKEYIHILFKKEGLTIEDLDYIFCKDEYLLVLNRSYLQHDTYTDILTFDLSENKEKLIAEIYISVERVLENAKFFQTSFEEELHRVIFHGALHLCGYDDHRENDKKIMRQKENQHLSNYFSGPKN